MKINKDELRNIIEENGQIGDEGLIKRTHIYLGGNEDPSSKYQQIQYFKNEETISLICFIDS